MGAAAAAAAAVVVGGVGCCRWCLLFGRTPADSPSGSDAQHPLTHLAADTLHIVQ